MRRKLRKFLWDAILLCFTLAVLLCITLTFSSWSWAYVPEDYADLPEIKIGDIVQCVSGYYSDVPNDIAVHHGKVTIVDYNGGRTLGQGMLLDFPGPLGPTSRGYTMLQSEKLRYWVEEFGGNIDFVRQMYNGYICQLTWGSKVVNRMWVGDLANLCGATFMWYDNSTKIGYFNVTSPPNAWISGPLQAVPGQSIQLRIGGKSNVPWELGFREVSYVLKANGNQVASNYYYYQNSFYDTVTYKVPSEADPGSSVTFELTVKDGVWRTTTKTHVVQVVPNPFPPPPPPPSPPPSSNMEPVADFNILNPNPVEEELVVLQDASYHPGYENGERIEGWFWLIYGKGGVERELFDPTVAVSWPEAGTYRVDLLVWDQDEDFGYKTKYVVVAPAPPEAYISVNPKRILMGREVTISGDNSKARGNRTIQWDQNEWQILRPDGSVKWTGVQRYPANPPSLNQIFDSPGIWKIRLRVTDSDGNKSEWAEETLEVLSNQFPVAFFQDPGYVAVGQSVTLRDDSWDPDGDAIIAWKWTVQHDDSHRRKITRIWYRGQSEPDYDWAWFYGWNGSDWVELFHISGYSYDMEKDLTIFGDITALLVILTTDESVLWFPTYVQVYQVQLDDGSLVDPGIYLLASHDNYWALNEWEVPVNIEYYTNNVTFSWLKAGIYRVGLKVQDAKGDWSSEFYRDITVYPNNPPVARLSGPSTGYVGDSLTISGASSYDPDSDDYIDKAFWRYRKLGGDWTDYFIQNNGDPGFLTFTVTPDVAGQWQFELVVQDSHSVKSSPAYLTVTVEERSEEGGSEEGGSEEEFEIAASVIPAPAERGRKIRVTAWAKRSSSGEKIRIDSMRVYIPHTVRPNGQPALASGEPYLAEMAWDPNTETYVCEYLIPNRTVSGYWPDDGSYYLRIVGVKNSEQKEKLVTLTIKGHILDRRIIRTYKW